MGFEKRLPQRASCIGVKCSVRGIMYTTDNSRRSTLKRKNDATIACTFCNTPCITASTACTSQLLRACCSFARFASSAGWKRHMRCVSLSRSVNLPCHLSG